MGRPALLVVAGVLVGAATLPAAVRSGGKVATTLEDFSMPGTQAGDPIDPLYASVACAGCQGHYSERQEPYRRWASSMMARRPGTRASSSAAQDRVGEDAGEGS